MLANEMLKAGGSTGGGVPSQTQENEGKEFGLGGGDVSEVGKVVVVTRLDGEKSRVVPVSNLFSSLKPSTLNALYAPSHKTPEMLLFRR